MTRTAQHRHLAPPQRLAALADLLEFRRQQRLGRITMILSSGRRPRTVTDVVVDAAQQWGVSVNSLWRWISLYDRGNFESLARSGRGDSYFVRRADVAELAARLLSEKYSARAIHETLLRAVPAPAPSYPTVCKYARRLRAEARAARRRKAGRA
jgi:hypothetical protein